MRKNLLLLFIAGLLSLASFPLAAQNCPRNIRDCRGLCGWYVDRDRDSYCDLTGWSDYMINKRKRCADSLAAVAQAAAEKKRLDSLANLPHNNEDAQEIKNNGAINNPTNQTAQNTSNKPEVPPTQTPTNIAPPVISQSPAAPSAPPAKSTYDLILICSASLLLYLLTFYLSRRNLIKKSTHRKIWNVLLLLTFLATGLIGLFLAVQLNYDLKLDWFASLLYWHVEFGIGMAAISIFHMLWHLKYWLNIFKTGASTK
jgi:hypothetical protein